MKNQYYYIIAVLIICFVGFIFQCESYAVPAAPIMQTLEQGDGISFKARQWGDEDNHGWETEEGYSILFDEDLSRWTYAVHSEDGRLIRSARIVGKDSPPDVLLHVRPKGKTQLSKGLSKEQASVTSREALRIDRSKPQKVVPSTGTGNIPVILINFKDRTTTYTASSFNNLLFGTGNYSMKDYYQEVSYGAFTVSAGPSGVVGWYTASNTHDYYGSNDAYGYDRWPGTLVREAIAAADAAGFNFASYDQDGDCYVDTVAIIHQGNGAEASGVSTDIWSSKWDLNSAYYYGYSNGGEYTTNDACPSGGYIKVNDYIIMPETLLGGLTTIGAITHEYGHALGLPDLYDTDYSSEGIGNWSLMAGGSWNYVTKAGDRPAHLDAWCKYDLGWVTPTKVSATLTAEPITSAATAANVYQLRNGSPSTGGEYFLVENRQKTGFDAGLPGAGLLVWHIDESVSTNDNECYTGGPACTTNHYHVALVQADNLYELEKNINSGNAGDPYPGSTNNTSFTDSSSPNSKLYNGTSSKVSITNISTSGSTMTATLSMQGTVSVTAITLTLTPPSNTTVSEGGAVGPFSNSITNNTSSSYSFYVAPYLYTPNGNWINLGYIPITLSAGQTLSVNNLYLWIPPFVPTGTYYYWINIYDTSWNLIDQDYFYFVVTAK